LGGREEDTLDHQIPPCLFTLFLIPPSFPPSLPPFSTLCVHAPVGRMKDFYVSKGGFEEGGREGGREGGEVYVDKRGNKCQKLWAQL